MLRLLIILIPVAITLFALFDAISTNKDDTRGLPKWLWILLIVVTLIVGAALWFVFGRPPRRNKSGNGGGGGGSPRPVGPDDDPDFMSRLDWEQRKPKHDS